MFRGVSAVNLDAKGRIVLPTRYRTKALINPSDHVIITIDTEERCLLIYPLENWEAIEDKLASLPSFNPAARRIQRLLIGHATECDVDNSGRLLIPPLLREYANLTRQGMLVGQGQKLELWDEAHWQSSRTKWLMEEAELDTASLPDELKTLSL